MQAQPGRRLERLGAKVIAENPALLEDEVDRAVQLLLKANMARMSRLRWPGRQTPKSPS